MTDLPDIEGFKDAQVRLVNSIGDMAVFRFSSASAYYGSANYQDPYSSEAVDPLAGLSSAIIFSPIQVKCTVIRSDPSSDQGAESFAGGQFQKGHIWLRIPEGTYPSAIMAADRISLRGDRYRIMRFFQDGIASAADRLYVEARLENPVNFNAEPSGGTLMATGRTRDTFTSNGSASAFSLANFFVNGTTEVYVDGMLQVQGSAFDYEEIAPNQVVMTYQPLYGQLISIMYAPD